MLLTTSKSSIYELSPKDRCDGKLYAYPKEISLLSNDQKQVIGNITSVGNELQHFGQELQQIAMQHPELLPPYPFK